jgi:transketolase
MFHAFSRPSPLAGNPKKAPNFSIKIKNNQNKEITLADPRAIRSLILIMDQFAVNGGAAAHWGGPSAIAEICSALFAKMFEQQDWMNHFNFVNDIGHAENALYALKAIYGQADVTFDELKNFRSFPSRLTGHGESHLFPEGVLLSNGPLGSGFPQSQGLAVADKLLGNNRTTVCLLSDGAFMEGEAKEAMSTIAGLASKNKINPYLLIISYNDTKLSGRINQDSYSLEGQLSALSQYGWDLRMIADGHNPEILLHTFEKALLDLSKPQAKPICLVTKTIKGFGLQKTANMNSGGHGYPLKKYDPELITFLNELWANNIPAEIKNLAELALTNPKSTTTPANNSPKIEKEKIQAGFGRGAIAARQKNLPLVSISADLQGSTGIAPFHKEFPQFSYDIGVAESNMVSMAAGMAKAGFIPMVDTFAAFGATKGNLPLIMASLSEAPVMAFFSHIGFQDAADGASHQSLTYFSSLCSIPNTVLISPASAEHAELLVRNCAERMSKERSTSHQYPATHYIFFTGREDAPKSYGFESKDKFGSPTLIHSGADGILVSQGNLLEQTLQARDLLKSQGLDFGVVHHTYLNMFDGQFWKETFKNCKGNILSIEDHQEKGGIGNYLIAQLCIHLPGVIKKSLALGVAGKFGQSAHNSLELYKYHGLDAASIAKSAQKMIV